MFAAFAVRTVAFCRRFALLFILAVLAVTAGAGVYVVHHIKINTDVDGLLADNLAWRQSERDLAAAFPQKSDRLVIVVDGANGDVAEDAAARLSEKLKSQPALFKNVTRPENDPTFQTHGLLYLSQPKLTDKLDVLVKAQPMLGALAADPTLRGLFATMGLAAQGIARGDADAKVMEPSFTLMAQTIEAHLDGKRALLPWQSMVSDSAPTVRDLRKFILTQPVLDFSDLAPGSKARKAVRDAVAELGLNEAAGVSVRMTGSVALNDEEFSSVAEGMTTATIASLVLVLGLLYLALRSARLIYPILLTLLIGLIWTTAFGLWAVGSLNLISVAFAVMFVGIAVDFGIQVGVRYRECRFLHADEDQAMRETARTIALPLAMAAMMTAIGFAAFIPTDYRGVAELGIIACAGMIIAFLLNMTLLPALLTLAKPKAEAESVGYAWAAPADTFLEKHRKELLIALAVLTVGAGGIAAQIRFDYDPLNLKNPQTESASTLFDIMKDPQASPYVIEILAPSLAQAQELAAKIDKLPQVEHTQTLASFLPEEQDAKLAMIADTNMILDATLNPPAIRPAPDMAETLQTFTETAAKLRAAGADNAVAKRLADDLDAVAARKDPELMARLDADMIGGMKSLLDRMRKLLATGPVAMEDLSPSLHADWITADGRAKIEVYPQGNARDPAVLTAFTDAVRTLAPQASGAPVSILESGKTVSGAFLKAGILALIAIALMSWAILRRIGDVLRLLAPLILAGLLTLATMVLIRLPLNFANIIALPLLLSLGVSYAIYFVTYWRDGQTKPLQSSTARAVLFSAGTTLVAFGSLMMSSHPGTSGMGQLLTIAPLYSAASAFFALPVLLGRPRSAKPESTENESCPPPRHED